MTIPTRRLGKDGPIVPAVGFGCMGLSAGYGSPLPDEERLALLDHAYEIGETFWDSADVYNDNEDLLGDWFAQTQKRSEIFLATKFGIIRMPDGTTTYRSDPEYVRTACAKSLERLGTEYIDLYYCHRVDRKTPIEKTVEAMVQLKKEGKIRHLGLSECSADTVRRAHKIHPIAAVQLEYGPFTLDIESPTTDLLATCRELGIAIVAYSPFGRGLATGRYRVPDDFEDGDFRKEKAPRYSKKNLPRNLLLVDKLEWFADKKGCSSAQLSLAWLLSQGNDIIPIPGTTKIRYLEENLAASKIHMAFEESAAIRKAIETCEVYGTRYPESMLPTLFGDTPPL